MCIISVQLVASMHRQQQGLTPGAKEFSVQKTYSHQSDTSEAIASSFIELSHTLEDFRAGLRWSAASGMLEDERRI